MKLLNKFIKNPSANVNRKAPLIKDPFIKSFFDISICLLLFLIAWPLFILISILIFLDDPGSIFYYQKRYGKNCRKFTIIKFRTMKEVMPPVTRRSYVSGENHRITRVGKFLRDTGLDELPQLLNVIGGDMSIVGPRPLITPQVKHYKKHIKRYNDRHLVRPGLTGLVQISDLRSEVKASEQRRRFKLDIMYINNWSVLFDIFIITSTVLMLWPRYRHSISKNIR